MLDYQIHVDNDSMYNTPPCWTVYICGLVFDKLIKAGGLAAMQAANEAKAKVLYDAINGSNGFYNSPVDPKVRIFFTKQHCQGLEGCQAVKIAKLAWRALTLGVARHNCTVKTFCIRGKGLCCGAAATQLAPSTATGCLCMCLHHNAGMLSGADLAVLLCKPSLMHEVPCHACRCAPS